MTTTYFLNLAMGNIFKSGSFAPLPDQYWVGLSSTEPTISGANVSEPSGSGTGYARVRIPSFSAPAGGVVKNSSRVVFGISMTPWGNMKHYVIYDKQTGGNLLQYGELTKTVNVTEDVVPVIEENEMVFTLKNETP